MEKEETRLEELEVLYTFVSLHTGKESIPAIMATLGGKIRDTFKFRGNVFGRLLLAPIEGPKGLREVAKLSLKNYIPLYHLIFGKDWHSYQQVNKFQAPWPYQVAVAKCGLLMHLMAMSTTDTWEEFLRETTQNWHKKVIQDQNKSSYFEYQHKRKIEVLTSDRSFSALCGGIF